MWFETIRVVTIDLYSILLADRVNMRFKNPKKLKCGCLLVITLRAFFRKIHALQFQKFFVTLLS